MSRSWLLLVLGSLSACSLVRECGTPPMAEITRHHGEVSASRAAAPQRFEAADDGTEFELGDAVRTARGASAKLLLDDGNSLDVRPGTTIRFSATRPGARARHLDVLEGEALLIVDEDATLETADGLVRAARGAQLRLRNEGGETLLVVTVGSARFESGDLPPRELGAGASLVIAGAPRPQADARPASVAPESPTPIAGAVTAALRGSHQVQSAEGGEWTEVAAGTRSFAPGTRIRQSEGGSIELSRDADRLVIRGAAEFSIGNGRRLVTGLGGSATFESSTDGVAIVTPGGVIVTRPAGGRTVGRLGRDADRRVTLTLEQGGAEVQQGGETTQVASGETVTLSEDAPEGPSVLADRVDLPLGAGDGLVIRDPHPPTAIGIVVGSTCADEAVVELLGANGRVTGSARGRGTIPVLFPEGNPSYRVRCVQDGALVEEPAARGRVRVIATSGQAPLPRTAPESSVEADGRTYQVVYSNRLPAITVRWPSGPDTPGQLVVSSGGSTRRVSVSGPRHRFSSGALGEGTHRVHFESGGRRSRDTTIVVRFDSAASAASLESPADGSFAAGDTVRVGGVALPGWRVEACGRELPVAGDQRFSGECTVPGSGVLLIRLVKEGQGASLYVRRARGLAP